MTKFIILNDPTIRPRAFMTSKHAIDIRYNCPKCGNKRMVTWLFPDTIYQFKDECCNQVITFEGITYE